MKKSILFLASLLFSIQLVAQTGLKVGDKAPNFNALDNKGKILDLRTLLKSNKTIVLFFYRGQWCPYCNKQIKELQDSLSFLEAKGAYIIGVSPETPDNIEKTINKTHASFSIIHDQDYQIMKKYDVNYTVNNETLAKFTKYGIDLENNNGNKDHVLPVPATFVIDKSSTIIYAHFDKDYTKRPSISSILKVLN